MSKEEMEKLEKDLIESAEKLGSDQVNSGELEAAAGGEGMCCGTHCQTATRTCAGLINPFETCDHDCIFSTPS